MRRVPISIKLLAALAAPLVGLLAITVIEVAKASRQENSVRSQSQLATATIGPTGVLQGLQDERNWAVAELVGASDAIALEVTGYDATRKATDEAITKFSEDVAGRNDSIAAAYQPAIDRLEPLGDLRREIDGDTAPRDMDNAGTAQSVFDRYSDLIQPLLDANTRVTVAVDNADLRQGAELVDLTSRQIETVGGLARALILNAITDGPPTRAEISEIATLREIFERDAAVIQASQRAPYTSVVNDTFPTEFNQKLVHLALASINGEAVDVGQILAVVNQPADKQYGAFRSAIADVLESEADALAQDANRRKWLFYGLGFLAIAVVGLATWLVSQSITRPLRALTRQATDMANHRLPDAVLDILDTPLGDDVAVPAVDPVSVRTRDEVADVAYALNTVQDSALDLAVEQAVLRRNIADSFVNLGRRNQNLLGRQLDFITELEHNEADPDTLANLFRLDHLATRMRRNAESLLVLAGIDPPRKWAAPVRITDAIRAALGEVEDYQRVAVRNVEPTTVLGSAAADLAHLLAELIENALLFSPPDQSVEVRGKAGASGASSGYTLAVIDAGLGMPPDELARANRRLAGAESFTIAPSKYLGHYVAGNLAARHNINVTLHNSAGHGITATINLPPSLLTTSPMGVDSEPDTALGAPELTPADAPPSPPAPVFAPEPDVEAPAPPEPAPPPMPRPPPAPAPAWPEHDVPQPVAASNQTSGGLAKRSPHAPNVAAVPNRRPTGPNTGPNEDLLKTLANVSLPPTPTPPPLPPTPPPSAAPPRPPLPARQTPPTGTPITPAPQPPASPSVWSAPPTKPPLPERPEPRVSPAHAPRRNPPTGPAHLSRFGAGDMQQPSEPPKHTPSGLARRVRGAQLPTTEPAALRRSDPDPDPEPEPPSQPRAPVAPRRAPKDPSIPHRSPWAADPLARPSPPEADELDSANGDHKAADEVYSFLSNFTAGVQRGLDEAQHDTKDQSEP